MENSTKQLFVIRINGESGKKYVRIVDKAADDRKTLCFEVTREFNGEWEEIPFDGKSYERFEELILPPKSSGLNRK